MHSNFISPPDFVEKKENHTVLIIDPNQKTVLDIGMICKSAGTDFDIYLYASAFEDLAWLEKAFNLSDAVLINTEQTSISPIKDRLVSHQKSYNYGPKNFFTTTKKIRSAQEYFLLYIQNQQNLDLTD